MITIRRITTDNTHLDQKWLVLEGSVEGTPVVKRRSINTAALVSGDLTLAAEKARLIADVEEYHARWIAVQQQLQELK